MCLFFFTFHRVPKVKHQEEKHPRYGTKEFFRKYEILCLTRVLNFLQGAGAMWCIWRNVCVTCEAYQVNRSAYCALHTYLHWNSSRHKLSTCYIHNPNSLMLHCKHTLTLTLYLHLTRGFTQNVALNFVSCFTWLKPAAKKHQQKYYCIGWQRYEYNFSGEKIWTNAKILTKSKWKSLGKWWNLRSVHVKYEHRSIQPGM